jgi:hypothetical protein
MGWELGNFASEEPASIQGVSWIAAHGVVLGIDEENLHSCAQMGRVLLPQTLLAVPP